MTTTTVSLDNMTTFTRAYYRTRSNLLYLIIFISFSLLALVPAIFVTFYSDSTCSENTLYHFYSTTGNFSYFSKKHLLRPPFTRFLGVSLNYIFSSLIGSVSFDNFNIVSKKQVIYCTRTYTYNKVDSQISRCMRPVDKVLN